MSSSQTIEEEKNPSIETVSTRLNFINTAAHTFSLDQNPSNNVSRQVKGYVYSKVTPTPLINP